MKEKIYTIPINDALDAGGFCPFCQMFDRLEKNAVSYAVGPAMMEPDFRQLTNAKGFCKKHMRDLHAQSKALPLALVMDTHLAELDSLLSTDFSGGKKSLFKKGESVKDGFAKKLSDVATSCVVCDSINDTFSRYFDTFVYMLKKEKGFLEKVLASDGFCIEHFARLAEIAANEMADAEFEKYFLPVINLQKKRVQEFNAHIKNFVNNFDYRNANNKAEVPENLLLKTGNLLNGEFEPKEKKLDNV
ncbi:MAG: hypothetical protein IKW02_01540 [Clostridia bacterium]|nr:hypothetical protein [Clostridia bacterium]